MGFGEILSEVRRTAPLVQCITNFVTVNDCANILLASGGRPTMASHPQEVEEAVAQAKALVCNLGAIDKLESMILAGKEANRLGIPVVLDPVGAGTTRFRREMTDKLLGEVRFTVIRGNASEIRALAGLSAHGSGVDAGDAVTADALPGLQEFSRQSGSVLAISGETDVVLDGTRVGYIQNGCPMMARITGSGCMLAALTGAFCGSWADPFEAACAATAAMDVAGELALDHCTGNASFRTALIDGVYNLTADELDRRVRYEFQKH